jgi:hypothetical protein
MNLRRVRRRALAAGVAAFTGLGLFATFAPTAHGADASSGAPVTGGSWFWAEQVPVIDVNGGQPGQPANPLPPDVPEGDFVVAAKGGQADKVSALHIDTSAIPSGSTISSFTLTLQQDDAKAHSVGAASGAIRAYAATDFFADGSQARPIGEAPAYDATGPFAPGTLNGTATWVFDLKAIVQAWASGTIPNNGIVLAPSGDAGQSFEVVWVGAQPPPVTDGAFTPPAGTSDSGSGGSLDSGSTSSGGSLPDSGGGATSISPDFTSPVSAPTPSGTPAAPPAVRAPARSIALGRIGKARRAPPLAFYLALVAFAALVGGCMVALGDAGEPILERRGSVMRTLERRNPSSV